MPAIASEPPKPASPSREKRPWTRALAPAEWVLLAYVLVAFARMATLGIFDLRIKGFPRDDIVGAALLVGAVRLAAENRRVPWPEDAPHLRKFRPLVWLFVGPFALVLAMRPDLFPMAPAEGGSLIPLVITAHTWLRTILMTLLPPAVFALVTTLHVKRYGHVSMRLLVVDSTRSALRELRDWAPPFAMVYAYGLFGTVSEHPWFRDQDAALAAIDRAIFFGRDPVVALQAVIWAPLSEWLSACYTFYLFLFPLVLGVAYANRNRAVFREVAFSMTFGLAVGYVGYTIVPARGPLFTTHFDVSLDLYYVGWLKDQLMDKTRVPRDCFPSLHTCMSLVMLWGAYRHARRLFWVLLPVVLSIPFACVYLRYHYVVDIFAGLALFGLTTVVTKRLRARGRFDDVAA